MIKKCRDLFETESNKHEIHYTYLDCLSLVVPLSSGRSAMRFFINKAAGFTTELYRKTQCTQDSHYSELYLSITSTLHTLILQVLMRGKHSCLNNIKKKYV